MSVLKQQQPFQHPQNKIINNHITVTNAAEITGYTIPNMAIIGSRHIGFSVKDVVTNLIALVTLTDQGPGSQAVYQKGRLVSEW